MSTKPCDNNIAVIKEGCQIDMQYK